MKSHEVYDTDEEGSEDELQSVGVTGLFIFLLPLGVIVGIAAYLFL